MTGGVVVVLGQTGRNIAAGMTGGIAFLLDENNAVEFREIEILEDTTDGLWVSGLKENERIITLGQEYVFQGQTVNVKEISYPEA